MWLADAVCVSLAWAVLVWLAWEQCVCGCPGQCVCGKPGLNACGKPGLCACCSQVLCVFAWPRLWAVGRPGLCAWLLGSVCMWLGCVYVAGCRTAAERLVAVKGCVCVASQGYDVPVASARVPAVAAVSWLRLFAFGSPGLHVPEFVVIV